MDGREMSPPRGRSLHRRERPGVHVEQMGNPDEHEGEISLSTPPGLRTRSRSLSSDGRSLRSRSQTPSNMDGRKRRGSPLPKMKDFQDMLPKRKKMERPASSLGLPTKVRDVRGDEEDDGEGEGEGEGWPRSVSMTSFLDSSDDEERVPTRGEIGRVRSLSVSSRETFQSNSRSSSPESVKSDRRYPKANMKKLKKIQRSEMFQMAKMNSLNTKSSTREPTEPCTEDRYCWSCHRDGKQMMQCTACPRVFHLRCTKLTALPLVDDGWVCQICRSVSSAERSDTRAGRIPLEQLCFLFSYTIQSMKECEGSEPFWKAVDTSVHEFYRHYVAYPMDLALLEENVRKKSYGSTEAFEADAKWILHNCTVFNAPQHNLTTIAKRLMRVCTGAMHAIESCPDCYLRSFRDPDDYFTEICPTPHLPIWAKLKGFPYWPAKVMRMRGQEVEVRFFGDHDRSNIQLKDCFLYSKTPPTLYQFKKGYDKLRDAVEEMKDYIAKLEDEFGKFCYAEVRAPFNPNKQMEHLMACIPNYNHETKPANGDGGFGFSSPKHDQNSVINKTDSRKSPIAIASQRKGHTPTKGDTIKMNMDARAVTKDLRVPALMNMDDLAAVMDNARNAATPPRSAVSPPLSVDSPDEAEEPRSVSVTAWDAFQSVNSINIVNVMTIEKSDFDRADLDSDDEDCYPLFDREVSAAPLAATTPLTIATPKIKVVDQSLLMKSADRPESVVEHGQNNPPKEFDKHTNCSNNTLPKAACGKQNSAGMYPISSLLKGSKDYEKNCDLVSWKEENVKVHKMENARRFTVTNSGPSPISKKTDSLGKVGGDGLIPGNKSPLSKVHDPFRRLPKIPACRIASKKLRILGSVDHSTPEKSYVDTRKESCDSTTAFGPISIDEAEERAKIKRTKRNLKSPAKTVPNARVGSSSSSPHFNTKVGNGPNKMPVGNRIPEHSYSRVSTDAVDCTHSSTEADTSDENSRTSVGDPPTIAGDCSEASSRSLQPVGCAKIDFQTRLGNQRSERNVVTVDKARGESEKNVSDSLRPIDSDDLYSIVPDPNAVDPLACDDELADASIVVGLSKPQAPQTVSLGISVRVDTKSTQVSNFNAIVLNTSTNTSSSSSDRPFDGGGNRALGILNNTSTFQQKTPVDCVKMSDDVVVINDHPMVDLTDERREGHLIDKLSVPMQIDDPKEVVVIPAQVKESQQSLKMTDDKAFVASGCLEGSLPANVVGSTGIDRTETYLDPKTGEWRSIYLPEEAPRSISPTGEREEDLFASMKYVDSGSVTISVTNDGAQRPRKTERALFSTTRELGPTVNLSKGISLSVVKGRKPDITLANLLAAPTQQDSPPMRQTARKSFARLTAGSPNALAVEAKSRDRRGSASSNTSGTDAPSRRNSSGSERAGPSASGKTVPMVVIPATNSGASQYAVPLNMLQAQVSGMRQGGGQPKFIGPPQTRLRVLGPQGYQPEPPIPPDGWSSSIQQQILQVIHNAIKERAVGDPNAAVVGLQMELNKQAFLHSQEIKELKHHFNLTFVESQECFASALDQSRQMLMREHQRAQEDSQRLYEKKRQELERAVELAKKKQWCTVCGEEAQLYCCWNTSYCDYPCQDAHWKVHMEVCRQKEQNNGEPEPQEVGPNNTNTISLKPSTLYQGTTVPINKSHLSLPIRTPTPPLRPINQFAYPRINKETASPLVRIAVSSPGPQTPRFAMMPSRAPTPGTLMMGSFAACPTVTAGPSQQALRPPPYPIVVPRPPQVSSATLTSTTTCSSASGPVTTLYKLANPLKPNVGQRFINIGSQKYVVVESNTIPGDKNNILVIAKPVQSVLKPGVASRGPADATTPSTRNGSCAAGGNTVENCNDKVCIVSVASLKAGPGGASEQTRDEEAPKRANARDSEVVSSSSETVVVDPPSSSRKERDFAEFDLEPTQLFGGYESPASPGRETKRSSIEIERRAPARLDATIDEVARDGSPLE